MKFVDSEWFLWILWFYIWIFYSLNKKLISVLRLWLEWESLMSGGWVGVDKYFKPLMERRCPKTERWITGSPNSMVFSIDEWLFAVCCHFLFIIVVNEMDRGLNLFSCFYLIPFAQLFSWTLAVAGRIRSNRFYLSSLSLFLAGCFLPLGSLFFSKFCHMKFIVTEPDFPEEWLMLLKWVKWTKNGSKKCFC